MFNLSSFYSTSKMTGDKEFVPQRFVSLLRFTLPKVLIRKGLDIELINVNFWKNLPKKFTAIANYEINKQKEDDRKGLGHNVSYYFNMSYL